MRRMRRRRWPRRARMGKLPIFVGGTGLYFMALTEGLADIPPIAAGHPRRRARAAGGDRRRGAACAAGGAGSARPPRGLRPTDPQRVLRAYEVFEATGRPLAEWQQAPGRAGAERPAAGEICARSAAPELARPHRRAVRGHGGAGRAGGGAGAGRSGSRPAGRQAAGPAAPDRPGARASSSRAEALAQAVTATRQFAKRQMTWFRHRMADYVWFDP